MHTSIKVLRIQKKGWLDELQELKKYESCRQKFKENGILMVNSLYILEVLCFIKKYKGDLKQNCVIHEHKREVNMTCIHDLVIHLSFTKVCYTWALGCINVYPRRLKNYIIPTVLERK